jgi:hypothetical protein
MPSIHTSPMPDLETLSHPHTPRPRSSLPSHIFLTEASLNSQFRNQHHGRCTDVPFALTLKFSARSRPNPSPGAITAVQELVSLVASSKQAQEIERTRRLAWEKEQEAKYIQRQAEMERQMLEMRSEIVHLRSLVNANHSGLFTPYTGSPAIANLRHPRPASPISPVSQPSSQQFVQGSSRLQPQSYSTESFPTLNQALQYPTAVPHTVTPSPSRHGSEAPSSIPETRRKRRRSVLSSEDESGTVSDSSTSCSRSAQRTDHHDKRILTIQVCTICSAR